MNKVYSPWAFTANEDEKRHSNTRLYKELCEKYRVARRMWDDSRTLNLDDYDVVIYRTARYLRSEYRIAKNAPALSNDELALLCDQGNLCFGHKVERNGIITVWED